MYASDHHLQRISETRCRAFVCAVGIACVSGGIFAGLWFSKTGAVQDIVLETRINPNTAPAASLMRLPDIGPQRARAIIVAGVRRWLCFD